MAVRLLAIAVLLTGFGFVAGSNAAVAADARPNIVVIMTDDQTLEDMWVLSTVRERIGREGTTFQESFASYPLCCPSRATYLTGQLPHNHDVLDNRAPDGGYQKIRTEETLPVWMSRAGYHTTHIGKYPNGYGKDPTLVPPGWQEWHGLVNAYRMYGYTMNHNGTVKRYGHWSVEDPALYQTDVLRELATDYIDAHADDEQPFFLSWAPLAPHTELYPEQRTASRNPRPAPRHMGTFSDLELPRSAAFNEPDMSDKPGFMQERPLMAPSVIDNIIRLYRSRLEALLSVDEAVKAIIDRLEAHDVLSDTVILFTSDNGFLAGQHRIQWGKIRAYDPSARVPLLIRGPGIPRGQTSQAMVSNVDVVATVLDYANTTPGITIDGRSLVPIAQSPNIVTGRHLLLETGEKNARSIGDRWYAGIRTDRYLYVEHWQVNDSGVDVRTGVELYDEIVDPEQVESRHRDPAYLPVRKRLAARLGQLQKCVGAACWGL